MDRVNFLTIDTGDDLVLSFSFDDNTKYGVDGFGIQRSPKYEFVLEKYERGPSIEWTDDDVIILLREFSYDRNTVEIIYDGGKEQFDISKIHEKEFERMIVVLKKMNFDNAFRLIKKI
ncbi:MAG TPA: hypothetical protein VHO70_09585 [Chitinispirillaceae bacterium]|nr:hypothetical protein [Chitinispirillaceae bacterium]